MVLLYLLHVCLLQGKYQSRDDINSGDVISRLALLTLHFPRLRLFWCQSPHATAELFHAVKTNRAQPDVKQALATSGESDDDVTAAKYNHRPHVSTSRRCQSEKSPCKSVRFVVHAVA